MEEKILAWHFAKSDRKLNYGDNRPIVVGETHTVEGEIELCERGLHASLNILDALNCASGLILYRVELSGNIIYGEDKLCASRRKYLEEIDSTKIVRQFARDCAKDVLHLWDAPKVVTQFIETGDESLVTAIAMIAANVAARAAEDAWLAPDAWVTNAAANAAVNAWAIDANAIHAANAVKYAVEAVARGVDAVARAWNKKVEYNQKLTESVLEGLCL